MRIVLSLGLKVNVSAISNPAFPAAFSRGYFVNLKFPPTDASGTRTFLFSNSLPTLHGPVMIAAPQAP
jgi:hypothetical protein